MNRSTRSGSRRATLVTGVAVAVLCGAVAIAFAALNNDYRPADVTATLVADGGVTLEWTVAGNGETSHTVEWSVDDPTFSNPETLTVDATDTVTFPGLSEGSEYYFRVRGMTADDYSDWETATPSPVIPDATAPSSIAVFNPAEPDGENGWYVSDPQVSIDASDTSGGSGVHYAEWSLTGGEPWSDGGCGAAGCHGAGAFDPFEVAGIYDGEHTLVYRSTDVAGNVEDTSTPVPFKVDTKLPVVSIETDPSSFPTTMSVDATITANDPDDGSGIVQTGWMVIMSGDNAPEGPNDARWTYEATDTVGFSVDTEGEWELWGIGIDEAGNWEADGRDDIVIDRSAPVTTLSFVPEANGANGTWYTDFDITFEVDDLSSVETSWTLYEATLGAVASDSGPYPESVSVSEDGTYTVVFNSWDELGQQEGLNVEGLFVLDKGQPIVRFYPEAGDFDGNNGWFVNPFSLEATVTIGESMDTTASAIYYQLDGTDGDWIEYMDPVWWSLEGTHTIYAYAVTDLGTVGPVVDETYELDTYEPAFGPSSWSTREGPAQILVTDATSGVQDARGRDLWATSWTHSDFDAATGILSVYPTALWVEGENVIRLQARDVAGNVAGPTADPYYAVVRVDGTMPVGTMDIEESYTPSTSVNLTLDASDPISMGLSSGVASMRFKNMMEDWSEWIPYSTTATWTIESMSGEGTKTVYAQFKDVAGNESIEVSDDVVYDTTAPNSSAVFDPVTPDGMNDWYVTTPMVSLEASDSLSPVHYIEWSLNGGDWEGGCDADGCHGSEPIDPFEVTGIVDGEHALDFRAVDLAGNVEDTNTVMFKVDTTAPETSADYEDSYNREDAEVTLTPADATSGVANTWYLLDGGSETTYTVPVTVPSSELGTHTVEFYSADMAGNIEATKTIEFVIVEETKYVEFAGDTRYDTAVAASQAAFTSADTVVMATGQGFADALGGSALAGVVDGPLLLTKPGSVPAAVNAEIDRLGATRAYILGGTGAISADVEASLKAKLGAANVIRLGGATRYETGDIIAEEVVGLLGSEYAGGAFVATGVSFPDALGAAPVAASQGMPILLASSTDAYIPDWLETATILGGTGAVSTAVENLYVAELGASNVQRIAGPTRFETAALVADYAVDTLGMSWDGVGIATGLDYPDAFAAGPVLGSIDAVMLLTQTNVLPKAASDALEANRDDIFTVHYFGGTGAVSNAVRTEIGNILY